jgi:A/G-specific adenine glycosylase
MRMSNPSLPPAATVAVRRWYAPRARAYAWRRGRPSAYRTLVSEVMLQQTQASRVEPVFVAFLRRFPSVRALAAAEGGEVLRAWAGLGYNRRAVSLHRAARIVVARHGGRVPVDPVALRSLPGVGPYTAAAVASIAGGAPVPALDVNVRRLVSRVAGSSDGVDEVAAAWADRDDIGGWNQALMDIGREHCRAMPRCAGCPLEPWCAFRRRGGEDPWVAGRPQSAFDGSMRQVRGRVVALLRERPSAGRQTIRREIGGSPDRVDAAIGSLVTDAIVERRGASYRLPASR